MKISLLLPCKNEIVGLRVYLPDLLAAGYHQLLVVDGGSTDGSIEYAESLGCEVVRQKGKGVPAAYRESYDKLTGDAIIVFSPDGNSKKEALPDLIAKLEEGYDLVICSRYKDDARSFDDTFMTGLGNWGFTLLISLFGHRYTDALVMYRGYRRDLPEKLGLTYSRGEKFENTRGMYSAWESVMCVRAAKAHLRITEVAADEPVRLDTTGQGLLLPATRIQHYRIGFYILMQIGEEIIRWRWPLRGGGYGP